MNTTLNLYKTPTQKTLTKAPNSSNNLYPTSKKKSINWGRNKTDPAHHPKKLRKGQSGTTTSMKSSYSTTRNGNTFRESNRKISKRGILTVGSEAQSKQEEWVCEGGTTYITKQPEKINYQTQRMIEMIPAVSKYGVEKELWTKVRFTEFWSLIDH